MNIKKFDYDKLKELYNNGETETSIRTTMKIKTQADLKRLLYDLSELDDKHYSYPRDKKVNKAFRREKGKIIINVSLVEMAKKNGFDYENCNVKVENSKIIVY